MSVMFLVIVAILYVFATFVIAQGAENNRGTNFVACMTIGLFTSPIGQLVYVFYEPNHKKDQQHRELMELLKSK
ncbi:hypothetical protein [Aeromonas hydrophila]|uniref:hypothetical protein n=1 Tax=Aeromonas hydrophila TaxID=644 RepID=UPI00235F079B|nr:hypothetical protein [Aeromonas hydrophila]